MCGIAGIISKHEAPDRELLANMQAAIVHRGPDDAGEWHDGPVAFGFRRLSIIDPVGGHQPMISEDQRYALVFNGEIYNYQQLRPQLAAAGWIFKSECDTEVLFAALCTWGTEAIPRLNGMFAFGFYDRTSQTLLLARDRFGKKPLYYYAGADTFLFASEIRALLTCPSVSRQPDPFRIAQYAAYRYVPRYETLFAQITCVSPGCWMEFDVEGFSFGEEQSFREVESARAA